MALVDELIEELAPNLEIPNHINKKQVFRGLMAIQESTNLNQEFFDKQDRYLQEELHSKGITRLENLTPLNHNIYLWQGDITTLEVDAVVNAANSQMLGCFVPNHACIDNAIHSQAGLQLRHECKQLMAKQGHLEPTGKAKITDAYNLPSKYVLHTVGPIIHDVPSSLQEEQLASCYRSCLELAVERNLNSLAFCCISTGEFRFPNLLAAQIAVKTVQDFCKNYPNLKVVFNVFKDRDLEIYMNLLTV
ncbi:protein-ADP-ribose hydrolase [Streptococcus entericus]|uniref:protein-ADP-ribose hydrolase n=1 Tax=Streptococcus entericus TaxID=155680 RepID=UPI000374677D|nr:protein-ADP-ribose hydrolase [Streptococcus entericus]